MSSQSFTYSEIIVISKQISDSIEKNDLNFLQINDQPIEDYIKELDTKLIIINKYSGEIKNKKMKKLKKELEQVLKFVKNNICKENQDRVEFFKSLIKTYEEKLKKNQEKLTNATKSIKEKDKINIKTYEDIREIYTKAIVKYTEKIKNISDKKETKEDKKLINIVELRIENLKKELKKLEMEKEEETKKLEMEKSLYNGWENIENEDVDILSETSIDEWENIGNVSDLFNKQND